VAIDKSHREEKKRIDAVKFILKFILYAYPYGKKITHTLTRAK
jgi:hypothetical protein